MLINFHSKAIPAALAISAFLTACGGGSGGSNGTAEPASTSISESQAFPVAQGVYSGSVEIFNGILTGANILANGATIQSVTDGKIAQAAGIDGNPTLKVLQFVSQHRSPAMVVGVEESVPCDSGSLTVSTNVTEDRPYRKGDSVTVKSNSCIVDGLRFAGSFGVVISEVRGTPYDMTAAWGISLSANYTNFGVYDSTNTGETVSGAMTLTLDENAPQGTYAVGSSGSNIVAKAFDMGSLKETLDLRNFRFVINGSGSQETFTIAGRVSGSGSTLGTYSYVVATPVAFRQLNTDSYPSLGQMTISGANATVSVTAIDNTSVRINYTDAAGTRTQIKPWSDLGA